MCDAHELKHIQDEPARQAIRGLPNPIEDLKQENRALREDNQRLRDAINQLKGEQGTPAVKGRRAPRPSPRSPYLRTRPLSSPAPTGRPSRPVPR